MSRRLILGLQQTLCRSFAASHSAPSLIQSPVPAVVPLLKWWERSSARSFAIAAAQTQSAPASDAVDLSEGSAQSEAAFPLLQRSEVPEDQYSLISRTTGSYSVNRKPVFAVVELGPTQFKVAPDDLVYSEKLKGVDVGDKVSLNKVLLLGNRSSTVIGRPLVPEATVTAIVEEQFLNGKVLVFKKRRRKNSRRLNGHRQALTGLRILDIHGLEAAAEPTA